MSAKAMRIAKIVRLCNLKAIGPAMYVAPGLWSKGGILNLQKKVEKVAIPEGITCVCSSQKGLKGVVTFY